VIGWFDMQALQSGQYHTSLIKGLDVRYGSNRERWAWASSSVWTTWT